MDKINSKKGSIEVLFICVIVIAFMFIFFSIYLLYSKINLNIYRVKQDLPNVLQNAVLAFDKEELAYNNFVIDEEELVKIINNLIDLNYDNVKLCYLSYDESENKVNVTVEIDLNLDKWNIENKVTVSSSIKLKMMELDNEI